MEFIEKDAGKSDARIRQGGIQSRFPPGRANYANGLPVVLPASITGEYAIARKIDEEMKRKSEEMEVSEECSTPEEGSLEKEVMTVISKVGMIDIPSFGEVSDKELQLIREVGVKETTRIMEGKNPNYMSEKFTGGMMRMMSSELTEDEKKKEILMGVNVIRNVVKILENCIEQKEEKVI